MTDFIVSIVVKLLKELLEDILVPVFAEQSILIAAFCIGSGLLFFIVRRWRLNLDAKGARFRRIMPNFVKRK